MKRILLLLITIATLSLSSFAQAPEGFSYQAVIRNSANLTLDNTSVGMQLKVREGSIAGTVVYTETFATSTNAYGLVNLVIGSGTTTDDFSTIAWATNGPFFIETAVDETGGTTYAVMGASQLMSVAYAFHAKTADNTSGTNTGDQDISGIATNVTTLGNKVDKVTGSSLITAAQATEITNNTAKVSVTEVADEFTATAAQTSFTLTQTKSAKSTVKMHINGVRISNIAYSVSGTTLTYNPANNGAYTLSSGDRVQFDYFY